MGDAEKATQENLKVFSGGAKEKTSSENSEYDSVDSYNSDEDEQLTRARSKASGLDSHSESEGSVILEREEGDGQESTPLKKVDDDEDKKNPQYIPKRGTFYEHDDRTAEEVEKTEGEETEEAKAKEEGKKKLWLEKGERWSHDRFNDNEQAPKSRGELIAAYGYDIRNEDGPPRARRRRRYGRGPNKYTRNWEDEEAYSKPAAPRTPKTSTKKPGKPKEEFPPLNGAKNDRARTKSRSSESNHEDVAETKENEPVFVDNRKSVDRQEPRNRPAEQARSSTYQHHPEARNDHNQNRNQNSSRVGSGRVAKPKKEIKDSDYKGFTSKIRQYRGTKAENTNHLPPRNAKEGDYIQTQNFTNKNSANQIAEMEREISQLNIEDGVYRGGQNSNQSGNSARQGSVPPRLQNTEQKGSKRYSSMRQRSLPETSTPPIPTNFSFYPSDYNSSAPPPATQQPLLPGTIPPTAMVAPPVPVSAAPQPIIQFPQNFAPQGPQAFIQAAPPPFIAPPAQPQLVSYVGPTQPFVQGYQGQFNAVTQPTELYQPQGGITYYSTDQQIVQRAAPQKRPKAAIPIVAPTDFKEKELARTDEPQE